MNEHFYYVRMRKKSGGNHRIAGVHIGYAPDGKFCRGVSICSPLDRFSGREAKNKAYNRYMTAVCSRKSSMPIEPNYTHLEDFLEVTKNNMEYKSEYDAVPTFFEKSLLRED